MARQFWKSLFAVLLGVALLAPTAAVAPAEDVGRIAAVVNDQPITFVDLDTRLRLALLSAGLPVSEEARQRFLPQVLRQLIDEKLQLVYSPLMPVTFREWLLDHGHQLIEVPDEEFASMGCNVLAIAPREVVMVKGNPETRRRPRALQSEIAHAASLGAQLRRHRPEGCDIRQKNALKTRVNLALFTKNRAFARFFASPQSCHNNYRRSPQFSPQPVVIGIEAL